jgi:hypothetical protein
MVCTSSTEQHPAPMIPDRCCIGPTRHRTPSLLRNLPPSWPPGCGSGEVAADRRRSGRSAPVTTRQRPRHASQPSTPVSAQERDRACSDARHASPGHRSASPARTPAVQQADDLLAEGDSAGIRPRHHSARPRLHDPLKGSGSGDTTVMAHGRPLAAPPHRPRQHAAPKVHCRPPMISGRA